MSWWSNLVQRATGDGGAREALTEIGKDLFSIEINTIVKPTMTAARFPGAAHAVVDIASEYDCFLADDFKPLAPGVARRERGSSAERVVSEAYFDGLRTYAAHLLKGGFLDDTPLRRRMIKRVLDNCDQLKSILAKNEPRGTIAFKREQIDPSAKGKEAILGQLSSSDLVILRKIWDIGLEVIAMQTVVHIDGDVITRLQPEYALGGSPGIFALHEETTRTALTYWEKMVTVAVAVVRAALGARPR